MGTDIHMYAEVLLSRHSGPSEWTVVGREFPSTYHHEGRLNVIHSYSDGDQWESNQRYTVHPYEDRNYDLFAILADVRNGLGFAGVQTGEGFNVIAEPRGLPSDVSPYVKKEFGGDESWYHSTSWLSLDEIISFDWDQVSRHCGWVNLKQYEEFKVNGKPLSWCGGVSGLSVRHISNEEADALLASQGNAHRSISYYTLVHWDETYRDSVGSFLTETVPNLQRIREMDRVEDLRIVFGFDS